MKKNISEIFSISINDISIKTTTTDKLGFIGSGEGIAAMSIVIISKSNEH
jgi:2-C-methyl-D-erythritol 2,4-cyclodiphosphate synthase